MNEQLATAALRTVRAMHEGRTIMSVLYPDEAQARRDARRIDANHHFAGDHDQEGLMPYLDGTPIPDAVECYVGEHGWVKCLLLDEKGHARITANNNVESVTVTGHVELRPKP
jgi:hypothetical protein